jgi:hypothetical protein
MVGVSPAKGLKTTDQGNRLFAYAGISDSPRVEATNDIAIAIAIARLSTARVMLTPNLATRWLELH